MSSPSVPPPHAQSGRSLVSLIVPAYDEAVNMPGLLVLVRQIRAAHTDCDFELVLIDDGSTDGTAQALADSAIEGDAARVVSLSRNFGSHAAITAGFAAARGDVAVTLSADLQEPMIVIEQFLREWRAGHDVVWGIRSTRSEPTGAAHALSRAFSRWFHRWSTIPTYPKDGPSIVLASRVVLDVINTMPELNRNVFGLVAWAGFRQTTLSFEQLPRPAGASKWTNAKKIKLVVDSFVEFSHAPIRVAGYVGFLLCVLGGFAALAAVLVWILPATGTTFWWLATLILVTGGLNLGVLSVLGEYVWRSGDDARRRPVYVLRAVHDIGAHDIGATAPAVAEKAVAAPAPTPMLHEAPTP